MKWHFGRAVVCLTLLALFVVDARRLYDAPDAADAVSAAKDVVKAEEAAAAAKKAAKKAEKAAEKAKEAEEEAEEDEEDDDDDDEDDDDDDDDVGAEDAEEMTGDATSRPTGGAAATRGRPGPSGEATGRPHTGGPTENAAEKTTGETAGRPTGETAGGTTNAFASPDSDSGSELNNNEGNPLDDMKNVDTETLMGKKKKFSKDMVNEWDNHCFDGKNWKDYPCRLGWKHGCREGICWSQCHGGWMLANAAEWCYVGEKKPKVEAGTADDSEFKYLDCKTDADCTEQRAYTKECEGICSMGKKFIRR